MSKKQLGAAPEAESAPVERLSWFSRLRAQPGFRTAAVAFVLTVALGVGGPAAYALWNVTASGTLGVTTARAALPALTGKVECGWNGAYLLSNVVISQPTPATALPAGAAVIMTITDPKGTTHYAVKQTGSVVLKSVPGLEDRLKWGSELSISITTAYLTDPLPTASIELIDATRVLEWSKSPAGSTRAIYRASYFCS